MELWGWGRKNTADVTTRGQLKTWAASFAEDHYAAVEGEAYTMDIDGITAAAALNWLAVIKNGHGSKNLVVTRIHLAPNTAHDDQELEVLIGGTFSYLAEGTKVTPTNMKAGGPAALGDFYVSDGTADIMTTITVGVIAARFPMSVKKEYDCVKQSNFIMPPDTCFMIRPSKDEKFRGFISFYYHE